MTNSSWPLFQLGLNPYGMTYYLGLQGRGTPRQNPKGTGLEGFLAIAEELGAHSLELFDPWLQELSDGQFSELKERLNRLSITPVISGGYILNETGHAFRSAQLLEAKTIRFALTNVLCGGRAFRTDWDELRQNVRKKILEFGALFSSLSGSGSTVYGIFNDEAIAKDAELFFRNSHNTILSKPK